MKETVVILRETDKGNVVALLPTIPVEGMLDTTILAYAENIGFFYSDVGIMRTSRSADKDNIWPVLNKLIIDEEIKPIRIYKRISAWMNEARVRDSNSARIA